MNLIYLLVIYLKLNIMYNLLTYGSYNNYIICSNRGRCVSVKPLYKFSTSLLVKQFEKKNNKIENG
jgi:hypothetical protein